MTHPQALIVEDDSQQSKIFCAALESVGYQTICLATLQEAINWLKSNIPHLVVLDLHLPDGNGESVAAFMQANEAFRQTRIILATADPQKAALLDAKVDLVLIKPVSFMQLRTLAERLKP